MPKTFIGNARNIWTPVVGIAALEPVQYLKRARYIYVGPARKAPIGYKGYVISDMDELTGFQYRSKPQLTLSVKLSVNDLKHGDILLIQKYGTVMVIWSQGARGNALFMTGACNSRCVMCPQPPTIHSHEHIEVNKTVLELIDESTPDICITGGEPTTVLTEFLEILNICNDRFPKSQVVVLTNGIKLAELDTAKLLAAKRSNFICYCVPLYSDIDDIHDRITGVQNSFYKTTKGLQNLALLGIPIELRHVITRMNYERLPNFTEFAYKNFPFVSHVALMGQEITGIAEKNAAMVWVDPIEYRGALAEAVHVLERRAIPVSVYNHQLCTLENRTRIFARRSISDWKNSYLPICDNCLQRGNCGGFFETSGAYYSKAIEPIK